MRASTTPVLLDGLRTPFGRLSGALSGLSACELNAHVIRALVERTPTLAHCDGVVLGQVLQAAQGQNPARLAAAAGGIDWSVPAITLNCVCPGALATVADASRRIMTGEGKLYLVGGGDSMSRAPHAALLRPGVRRPGDVGMIDTLVRDGLWCALSGEGMVELSERANVELGIDREVQDRIAYRSHRLAAEACAQGRFADEILPVELAGNLLGRDEGIRTDTHPERLAQMRPVLAESGRITAGNASQMSDGASIGSVASLAEAERVGRRPLARIVAWAEVAGPDNTLHHKPAVAIERLLERTGLRVADIDLFEINEAFAAVVAATCQRLDLPLDLVNVNGGAIAVGHPLGGTGLRLLLTLALELERRDGRYGVAAMCGGGGQGFAVVIERIS